jgi:hypothetical protein
MQYRCAKFIATRYLQSAGERNVKPMSIVEFNYIESGLWFLVAVILLALAFRQGASSPYFAVCVVSCVSFIGFGISDIIEAQTGAWWRPFWLFLIKAICVVTFIICYAWYKRIRRGLA